MHRLLREKSMARASISSHLLEGGVCHNVLTPAALPASSYTFTEFGTNQNLTSDNHSVTSATLPEGATAFPSAFRGRPQRILVMRCRGVTRHFRVCQKVDSQC
jgi:hypothetical protein